MTKKTWTARVAAGIFVAAVAVGAAVPAQAADSGAVVDWTFGAYARFTDGNNLLYVKDQAPDGHGVRAVLSIQQADGSWLKKAVAYTARGNGSDDTKSVSYTRENAWMKLEVCLTEQGTPLAWSCRSVTFPGA